MSQTPPSAILPSEAFDALFRAAELEERVEFQTCTGWPEVPCEPEGPIDPPPGGVPSVVPEPSTIVLSATGIGAVGLTGYLKRRAARRKDAADDAAHAAAPSPTHDD